MQHLDFTPFLVGIKPFLIMKATYGRSSKNEVLKQNVPTLAGAMRPLGRCDHR